LEESEEFKEAQI